VAKATLIADPTLRCAVSTTCYNRFVRWRSAGVWDQIIDAPTAAHDAIVQMIDTSVVPMGRSRGGLTGKIHAVVDANAAPVQLGLTAGELPITNSRLSY
jgi:transposase